MNKVLLLFALAALFLFSNCNRDKDPEPVTPATQENSVKKLLLGKWRIAFTAEDDNMNNVADESEREPSDELSFITFNIDGTADLSDEQGNTDDANMRWTLNDKIISLEMKDEADSTWNSEDYTIVSLNTLEMLWKFQEDSSDTFFVGFSK